MKSVLTDVLLSQTNADPLPSVCSLFPPLNVYADPTISSHISATYGPSQTKATREVHETVGRGMSVF